MVARGQHHVIRHTTGLNNKTTYGGRGTLYHKIIQTEDKDIQSFIQAIREKLRDVSL